MLRYRVFYILLDGSFQRSCSIAWIVTCIGCESLGCSGNLEVESGLLDAFLETFQFNVDDLLDILTRERIEEYLFVNPVDEFRRVP